MGFYILKKKKKKNISGLCLCEVMGFKRVEKVWLWELNVELYVYVG